MITDEELQQWADKRADDAGQLARYIIAMRVQVRAQMAATALHYRAVNVGQALKQLGDEDMLIHDMIEALRFYRDGFAFHPNRTITGIDLSEWKPKQHLLDDCGNVAKAVLAKAEKQGYGP